MGDDKVKWGPIENTGEGRERFATRSIVRFGQTSQVSRDAQAQRVDMGPSTDITTEGRERFATRSVVRCGPTPRASKDAQRVGTGATSALPPNSESNTGSSVCPPAFEPVDSDCDAMLIHNQDQVCTLQRYFQGIPTDTRCFVVCTSSQQ